MRIRTLRDVAAVVRGRRKHLKMTQAETAAAAAVSRKWMIDLENGRATGDLAAVLRVIDVLDLALDISEPHSRAAEVTAAVAQTGSATLANRPEQADQPAVDLDALLDEYLDR